MRLIRKKVLDSFNYEVYSDEVYIKFKQSRRDGESSTECTIDLLELNKVFCVDFTISTFINSINNFNYLGIVSLVATHIDYWHNKNETTIRVARIQVHELFGNSLPLEFEDPQYEDGYYLFLTDEFVAFVMNLSGEITCYGFNTQYLGEFFGVSDIVSIDIFEELSQNLVFHHVYNSYYMNSPKVSDELATKLNAYSRKRKIAKILC